jgi:hypothetical protein
MNRLYKTTVIFEISLLILMSFAIAYEIDQSTSKTEYTEKSIRSETGTKLALIYAGFVKYVIGDKNMVSAEDLSIQTCLVGNDGSKCQPYTSLESCQAGCNETIAACIPAALKDVAQCKLGICYDKQQGNCQARSPKADCENGGGQWFNENDNPPQCKKGCCLIGTNGASLMTQQSCNNQASLLGATKVFKPEIMNELSCLSLASTQEEGACVFDKEFETTCKFTTRNSCLQFKGDFNKGVLCSNPILKTNCKAQSYSSCVEGKDEIYWFDSCGNKENIYDSNKIRSFNDGKVLSKEDSCSVGTNTNPFLNQNNCGNCNYLIGSRCGTKTANEKLIDTTQQNVCRDLRCKDSSGNIKLNGESWCVYQGAIGTEKDASGTEYRSIDTAGSRNFRQVCIDGEVQTEPCAEYRNEVCVQSNTELPNNKVFASAACRINRWQQCIQYNTDLKSASNPTGMTNDERDDKCVKNPDCFVKSVNIAKNFKFNMCAPRYPPGFDLNSVESGTGAEKICGLASQKCTAVKVKGLGGWKWKVNQECVTGEFAKQMNDFCMSLGDCGAKVNYEGDLSESYSVVSSGDGGQKLDSVYLAKLKTYSNVIPGKVANPGDPKDFFGEIGIPEGLGEAGSLGKGPNYGGLGMIAGGMGIAVAAGLYYGLIATTATVSTSVGMGTVVPAIGAYSGAFAGAAIGLAAVALLIKFLGIGAGLPPVVVYALMAGGAVAGGMIGYAMVNGWAASGALGPAGIIVLVVIIVIMVIMKLFGIGKKKEITVTFTCKPWQAPTGGAKCDQCGKDNGNSFGGKALPCSKYSCQALGQSCELINENTVKQSCVYVGRNDSSAPVISPLSSALFEGYSYSDINLNGFKIVKSDNEGCLKASTPVLLGISVNEPAQCKVDVKHTDKFEDMEFDFGGRNLYIVNHTMFYSIPSIESLGIPGYNPESKADYSLYVRCQDKNGNKNVAEYAINFCLKPGNDETPPIVNSRLPTNEYVGYNQSIVNATIFVNEPSECRFDLTDKDYDLMNSSMNCNTNVEQQDDINGWACASEFNSASSAKYYIRCKDQPWLAQDEVSNKSIIVVNDEDERGNPITRNVTLNAPRHRNVMQQSYEYSIKKSESVLRIDSLTPDNRTLVFGTTPISLTIEARTSGGVNGDAICSFLNGNQWIEFLNTFEKVHTQPISGYTSGERVINVSCVDVAGNVAHRSSRFEIIMDTDAPKITRAYDKSGTLNIITDENSECYISNSECEFEIQNATMMSGSGKLHTSSFLRSLPNYVKCKDNFGNIDGSCSIVVQGGV